MRCGKILIWLVLILLATAPVRASNDMPAASMTAGDVAAWLDGYLPYALERGDVAGAVIIVVKDGQTLVGRGYGHADRASGVPVDPDETLFRIGSVGKLFTWTAVMQLVEAGRLDLDRDINEYLDFTIPDRDGQHITLRNLMTHTPGFEEIVKNLVTDEADRSLALNEYLKAWTPERIYRPGEVPAYSNYGASLAGYYIVQRVSGESLDDYLDHHLFKPLDMNNTTTRQPLPTTLLPHMSSGYDTASGPARPFEFVNSAPAGSATATGADMAKFMIAYLQEGQSAGVRILESKTVQQIFGTRLSLVPPLNGMLLGFMQQDSKGRRIAGHAGDTQFFHSSLDLFLDHGVGVFLSMNSTGTNAAAHYFRTDLVARFADRYLPVPNVNAPVDAETAAEHARMMSGMYKASRRAQSSFLNLANLLSQVEVSLDEDGGLLVSDLVSLSGQPMKWVEVAPFVWRQIDGSERLAARVENGSVAMFSVDSAAPFNVFLPVRWWESSKLLHPLLGCAILTIALTIVAWPLAAIARKRYGIAFELAGADAMVYRWMRLADLGLIALCAG